MWRATQRWSRLRSLCRLLTTSISNRLAISLVVILTSIAPQSLNPRASNGYVPSGWLRSLRAAMAYSAVNGGTQSQRLNAFNNDIN
ncbi:unnamed protein product [Medioppia subpectinata]|uniref:Uncharacterized protein n=1 Tax=Medioppia subpectinata TaxID=1979941 RepID=A0A7R9Q7V6_9ACAR|nr:unnamed protein product [Medioppia subpectinata]CAG2115981.1 unnamed protein product [Medioppia subpectinata]